MLLLLQFSPVSKTEVGSVGVKRPPSPTSLPGLDSGGACGGGGGGNIGLGCGRAAPPSSTPPRGAVVGGGRIQVVGIWTR